MTAPKLLLLDGCDPPAEEYFLPEDKLIAGNPRQTVWVQYADPAGEFTVGVWHSEPGKWRIHYTEEEYCHVLEGVSIVIDSDGRAVSVGAGDNFVIPAGFAGSWEVVEPTTKRFVIYERKR